MDSVSIVWRAKTDAGWRYFPVIMGRNGRIRKGFVKVDGKEVSYPDGHFEVRYYEGRKTKYKNVGTDATEAVNECNRMQHLSDARDSAASAGVSIVEPVAGKTIKAEAARWVKDTEDRGAMEAAQVNRTALAAFQLANPRLAFLDEITADSAVAFWIFLRKQGKSDRTVYNAHMRLTGFLRFAGVDYKAWRLSAPKYEKKLPNMYNPDEIERMLAACKREYNRVLITMLVKTGLRDQELMHLCWTDVDLVQGKLRVAAKPEYNWMIKDYEQRDILLPPALVELLNGWRKSNPHTKLVVGTINDKPNKKFLPAVKSIAKKAEVLNATLHRFRRTYGTTLLHGGMDLRTVQMLLGHNDIESTMRYLSPATGDEVRRKINAIL